MLDNKKLKTTLTTNFQLPKQVNQAKEEAFAKIKASKDSEAAETEVSSTISSTSETDFTSKPDFTSETDFIPKPDFAHKTSKSSYKQNFYKGFAAIAASAAIFSIICTANPALADNIPVVGSVFQTLGKSLGFYGDFKHYAKPLDTGSSTDADTSADSDSSASSGENNTTSDSLYSQTQNGTNLTLSEVYCNDSALYLSMTIQTENEFPDCFLDQEQKPIILFGMDSTLDYSFKDASEDDALLNAYLDGKQIDSHTYFGVLRLNKEDILTGENEAIPDNFNIQLNIKNICGYKLDDSTPEMPQDLKDAYQQAMAENGLDEDNYKNFTEEQQEIEHRLFTEMWNRYYERYPDATEGLNHYNTWTLEGDWNFSVDVEKNTSDSITKETTAIDSDGNGILSVTKTPFEISLDVEDPESKYFAVVLDADGNLMSDNGTSGSAYTVAIQDSDVSSISVYLCDYDKYMDELKGYYFSEDYQEKAKTKTFKQLLDEHAVASDTINFKR